MGGREPLLETEDEDDHDDQDRQRDQGHRGGVGGVVSASVTRENVVAAVQVIAAVAEAIRGLGEVPSGELYVHMSRLSIEQYGRVIESLKSAELVEERNHVLRWIGPK